VPLYEACGYRVIAPHMAGPIDGVMVPMQRMGKILD
jgi:hypothetical protein